MIGVGRRTTLLGELELKKNWRSLLHEGWHVLKKLKQVQLPTIQHLLAALLG